MKIYKRHGDGGCRGGEASGRWPEGRGRQPAGRRRGGREQQHGGRVGGAGEADEHDVHHSRTRLCGRGGCQGVKFFVMG